MQHTTFFTHDKYFYKRFFGMLLFIALQNVIVFSVNLADNIMLGSYNENALAGAALVNQIQFLLQMIVTGAGEGMIVLTSQYWGRRELTPIKRSIGIAMRVSIIGALVLTIATAIAPRQCLQLMTNVPLVLDEGVKYLQVMTFTFVVFAISNTLISALRSVENVRIGMFVSLSTLLVNVSLNYCLIFGNFGFPRLGSYGAALATLASRIIELIIVILYTRYGERILKLRWRDLLPFDTVLARDFLRVATPVILTSGIWGFAMMIQTSILGHMGVSATAANSVATTVFQILTVIVYGSSSASAVMIGKAVGQGDIEIVKQYTRTFQIIFLVIGALTGIALYSVRDVILMLYSDLSPATRELALQFMNVLSITVVGTGYQACVLGGIVRAGGSPKVQLYNDIIFMWCVVLPLSALAAFVWKLSPVVVFAFLKCDQVLKCGTAFVVCNRYRWIKSWVHE